MLASCTVASRLSCGMKCDLCAETSERIPLRPISAQSKAGTWLKWPLWPPTPRTRPVLKRCKTDINGKAKVEVALMGCYKDT